MSEAPRHTIYPRYCFHLSPTVNTWCLLDASDIHKLDQHNGFQGENFFFYRNLPIKWVRIVGVVVEINDFNNRRVLTVDDSSGACIEVTYIRQPNTLAAGVQKAAATGDKRTECSVVQTTAPTASYDDIDVGMVVDVKGGLSTFREEMKISLEKIVRLKSTAQELALWEKRAKLRRDVLDKPWVLSEREVRKCRKEAERSEKDVERRKRRPEAANKNTRSKREAGTSLESKSRHTLREKAARNLKGMMLAGDATGKYKALGL